MVEAVRADPRGRPEDGLISNSWSTAHYDRELLAELFDVAVISARGRDAQAPAGDLRLAAERLGVAPEECLFVDDLRENCEGAEAVGMTAVRHRDAPTRSRGSLS